MNDKIKDALKKEFGRLPRGLPNASNGVPVVDFINYALGLDNEIDTEDGDKPQPKLYDYRTGKVVGKPKTVGDAAKMAGLRLEEVNPLIEASAAQAARDARRAMRRDPDMRQLAFGKDDTATDKDVESAAKNIIMQLRKSVTMGGQKDVEFAKGKQKVPAAVAQKVLDMYMKQRTSSDKGAFQTKIAKSYKDLLNAIKGK